MQFGMRLTITGLIVGLSIGMLAAPAGAEQRTVPDGTGDLLESNPDADPSSRARADYVGASVTYTSDGVDVTVWTAAAAPPGYDVVHMLWLEGSAGGPDYRVLFHTDRTDIDVLRYGRDQSYAANPCASATRQVVGAAVSVHVPAVCVPELGPRTRFRIDTNLTAEWRDSLPDDGGYSLYRNQRPADAPRLAVDGPAYIPDSSAGDLYRLYRAFLGREPDRAGFDYWMRTSWSGMPLDAVAGQFASAREFQDRYGMLNDPDFVDRIYRNVLDRAPDNDGARYWGDQLAGGMPRGIMVLNVSASAEFRSATDGGTPPGYQLS